MGETKLTDLTYEEACDFFGPEIPLHVMGAARTERMPKYRYGSLLRFSPSYGVVIDFTVTQMFWDWRTEYWYYYIPGDDNIPVYQCESDLEEIE